MKVYIVTGEPFPHAMAATARIKCYAKAIIERGVECEVMIYRRTERYGFIPKNTEGKGITEGVPFFYIGGTPLRASKVFIRQLNDIIDKWNTIRYLSEKLDRGDVVLGYMGHEFSLVNRIISTAHKKGAIYVRDLCELPYGTGAETSVAIRGREKILHRQFPRLDGVIPISDTLQKLAQQYTSSECKFLKIPIMVDYEKYELPNYSNEVDVPYIFHSGTLYEQKDGILGMIEAFGIACQKINFPVKFISTGRIENSPYSKEITVLIDKYGLHESLIFTGYLSDIELKDYLSRASLTIINKYRTQQNRYCFSTKIGEYLAASKPVIITRVGEAMNWLTDKENAYIIEPEDTDALANAIVHVFQNREEARQIGIAGQKVCQHHFDYHNWSTPLINFFQELER